MKVLIACEESQTVCKEFRRVGHEAYSCDIKEPSGGHPEWHIKGDAVKVLEGGVVTTMDGISHEIGQWDMLIAHPPCTYLSNVATRFFSLRCTDAEKVVDRWRDRAYGAVFFMHFALAHVPRICIENPVGFMNSAYRKADQIIDPYQFAESVNDKENYVTKRTCLWLRGLPKLQTNDLPKPNNAEVWGRLPSGKARVWTDSFTRDGGIRSKTFHGIAKAMAEQWGQLEESEEKDDGE